MPHMHLLSAIRTSVLLFALPVAAVSVACVNTEPTPDEIVARSREFTKSVNSYATKSTSYMMPRSEEGTSSGLTLVERPGNVVILGTDGSVRFIIIGDTMYRPAESEPGKWSRSANENPVTNENSGVPGVLGFIFPPNFLEAEVIESSGDFYVIEGFGTPPSKPGVDQNWAKRHQLKIRKSNFAVIELTRWDFPFVKLDENGDIAEIIPGPGEDSSSNMLHMRTVAEFSRYDEDFLIEAPPESDIVIELSRTIPEDGDWLSSLTAEIGFFLSEAAPIMDLTIQPAIELIPIKPENPRFAIFTGRKTFKPNPSFERNTTYTATLRWGNSESDLNTHTWSFTTR
ncbi:MAG: hypothetical protein J4N80_12280 [Chloroflexi bacterium]|nr:hypothetical protein [Chloroflexota bacterium]